MHVQLVVNNTHVRAMSAAARLRRENLSDDVEAGFPTPSFKIDGFNLLFDRKLRNFEAPGGLLGFSAMLSTHNIEHEVVDTKETDSRHRKFYKFRFPQ